MLKILCSHQHLILFSFFSYKKMSKKLVQAHVSDAHNSSSVTSELSSAFNFNEHHEPQNISNYRITHFTKSKRQWFFSAKRFLPSTFSTSTAKFTSPTYWSKTVLFINSSTKNKFFPGGYPFTVNTENTWHIQLGNLSCLSLTLCPTSLQHCNFSTTRTSLNAMHVYRWAAPSE